MVDDVASNWASDSVVQKMMWQLAGMYDSDVVG
jgi:hypothetical protein